MRLGLPKVPRFRLRIFDVLRSEPNAAFFIISATENAHVVLVFGLRERFRFFLWRQHGWWV